MNLSFFISKRYFFSKKKKNFINIIAIISMVVVSICTAALIIALSVFNGMEDLLRNIYGEFDAPLKVVPVKGKSFTLTEELDSTIRSNRKIIDIIEVIEDNALLEYNNAQMMVKVKGYSENFLTHERMKTAITDGAYRFYDGTNENAIIGRGILYKMGISMRNEHYPLRLFYPKNVLPGTSLNARKYYNQANILTGGAFALEQTYDNSYIFTPLAFCERLFDYQGRRSSLELLVDEGTDIQELQSKLGASLGDRFEILSADQQHADIYKVLQIEKLFIFVTLSLIVAIASINIFFALSMLVTEKKSDISVLMSMGATKQLIRRIFLSEGMIIALMGAGSGLIVGFLVAWGQETFGFIKMGVTSAVSTAYPVKIIASDFIYASLCTICITFLASVHPSLRAANQSLLEIK